MLNVSPENLEIVKLILQKHVPVFEVWAFGSRVTGRATVTSDLDLAIICNEPLSISTRAALSEDFSESNLPWKVDIVDWAATEDSFRKIILEKYEVIQNPG